MKMKGAAAALVLGVVFLIPSCAKPPAEEMNAAAEAVVRAENDADAVTYAPNTLVRARDALERMRAEADSKQYDAAKTYAAEAVSAAERALSEGKAGAQRAREEAAGILDGLAAPLAETERTLDNAGRAGGLKLDVPALRDELDRARETMADAREDLAAGAYGDAAAKGRSVRSSLSGINDQIAGAAQAVSRKK
jgi:flagellar biosynthesis/type III secretory pathway protein FliH